MKVDAFINLFKQRQKAMLAVLVDPDKFNPDLIRMVEHSSASCILLGGSRLNNGNIAQCAKRIKELTRKPLFLFPGDEHQLTPLADGTLLPLLLSGRNADYLGGKQVLMAPTIRKMKLTATPIGYILVDGGKPSATEIVTGTKPMSAKSTAPIANTALACEYMGCLAVYVEAGSGAKKTVNTAVIKRLKSVLTIPLIAGGGVDSVVKAQALISAGANMIVVGNALEKDVSLLQALNPIFKTRS